MLDERVGDERRRAVIVRREYKCCTASSLQSAPRLAPMRSAALPFPPISPTCSILHAHLDQIPEQIEQRAAYSSTTRSTPSSLPRPTGSSTGSRSSPLCSCPTLVGIQHESRRHPGPACMAASGSTAAALLSLPGFFLRYLDRKLITVFEQTSQR